MPSIKLYDDRTKKYFWAGITDAHISGGYLQLFTVQFQDTTENYHLVRHDAAFWTNLGASIFNGATSLRSAKGLLQDFTKIAGREDWFKRAGVVGLGFGSAAVLTTWLKNRPYKKEGYYNAMGEIWLDTPIKSNDPEQYKP